MYRVFVINALRQSLKLLFKVLKYSLALALFLFLIQRSTYPLTLNWNAVSAIVRNHQFDYVTWELNAIASKTAQALWGGHPYMSEDERSQFVRHYMADLDQTHRLEAEIQALYTDPAITDADAESATLRAARDTLRADLRARQTTAESILEGQVSKVLVDEGFGLWGQLMPPMSMHFTRMPYLLVVSPRDRIARAVELIINPLPLEEIITIEDRILTERDMASLIVPLGGMALYPAMIQETANLRWAVETFAHEWMHHYLFFFPLGLNYFDGSADRETTIINETVADTFGKEIREIVLRRYYPELAESASTQAGFARIAQSAQGQTFDFGRVMHVTRVIVDKNLLEVQGLQAKAEQLTEQDQSETADAFHTLADALVAETEAYMEEQRSLLYERGWRIRKLNQAYFAFYGGYQAGDRPGVGGSDPIGPTVQEIRTLSPTLHDFIVVMRGITTREQLLALRDTLHGHP